MEEPQPRNSMKREGGAEGVHWAGVHRKSRRLPSMLPLGSPRGSVSGSLLGRLVGVLASWLLGQCSQATPIVRKLRCAQLPSTHLLSPSPTVKMRLGWGPLTPPPPPHLSLLFLLPLKL